jgi:adenylosuccinate synthase
MNVARELRAVSRELTADAPNPIFRDVARINKALSSAFKQVRGLNGIVRKSILPESPMVDKMLDSIGDAMNALDDAEDTFQKVLKETAQGLT